MKVISSIDQLQLISSSALRAEARGLLCIGVPPMYACEGAAPSEALFAGTTVCLELDGQAQWAEGYAYSPEGASEAHDTPFYARYRSAGRTRQVQLDNTLGAALRLESSNAFHFGSRDGARVIGHRALRMFASALDLPLTYSRWRGAWLVETLRSDYVVLLSVDGGALWEGSVFRHNELQLIIVRGIGVFAHNGEPLTNFSVRRNPSVNADTWWDALVGHHEGLGLKMALDANTLTRVELATLAALPGWDERPLLCDLVPFEPVHRWCDGLCLDCGQAETRS
jgi:hypothetical protein